MIERNLRELFWLDVAFFVLCLLFYFFFKNLSDGAIVITSLVVLVAYAFIRGGLYWYCKSEMLHRYTHGIVFLLIHLGGGGYIFYFAYDLYEDLFSGQSALKDGFRYMIAVGNIALGVIWGNIGWDVFRKIININPADGNWFSTFIDRVVNVTFVGVVIGVNLFFMVLLSYKLIYFFNGDYSAILNDADLSSVFLFNIIFFFIIFIIPKSIEMYYERSVAQKSN